MLRKTLFWIHLGAGLLTALPLAAMALTGILLSFESQIVEVATRESRQVLSPQGTRLPLDTLVARSAGERADKVTAVVFQADPLRTVEVRMGKEATLRVDPWSGETKAQGAAIEAAFGWVERIHRWFGSREIGGMITGVSVLLCLVLTCTGLVLWWPRKLAGLRNVVWPKRGLRAKARDWQWHNAVGILALPLLVVIALTGTVMSWKWAEGVLYAAAGAEAPRRAQAKPIGKEGAMKDREAKGIHIPDKNWQGWMDTALAHAPQGWTSAWISAPQKPGLGASVNFRTNVEPVPSGGTAVLTPLGGFEAWKPARIDFGTRLRFMVKPLHTGELFGWVGQLAMALASVATLLLAWTGVAMSWRRFFKRSRSDFARDIS
ncbi:MAG: PepSY-associated TM helix domain-containing protein [Fibrobacterota bacterium]